MNKINNSLLITAGGILGIYLLLLLVQSLLFSNRFGPFVKIAGVNVAWQSKQEAVKTVESSWESYRNSTITINDSDYKPAELVSGINVKKTVEESLSNQASGYLTFSPLFQKQYSVGVTLNDEATTKLLSTEFDKLSRPAEDAKIQLSPEVKILPEKLGQKMLIPESRVAIDRGLSNFETKIYLKADTVEPMITAAEAKKEIDRAMEAVNSDITLKSKLGDYTITKNELVGWLNLSSTNTKPLAYKEVFVHQSISGQYTFFDEQKVASWVNQLALKIDKKSKNATLGATNGQVVVIASAQTGYALDKTDLITKIENAATSNKVIEMKITETKPEITESKITEMGLKELVSTGYTDFAGSPTNRKVNIQVGSSKFNGAVIKPGEEFSFNTVLGDVDASTGYLPELVIKENKTVPEYGGGLCQVSSTAFRAALNAGLPITARYAHAYPVSYYKPFGVDATIYLPWPDLKFRNDTGHYILIQTRIEGTKLYFDFYGEKAARTVKFSGNQEANGAVDIVEKITPTITEAEARGKNSFTATFFRHIYDTAGKLISNDSFVSKYDSPDKYPH